MPLRAASVDLVIDKGTINSILADRAYRRQERAARRGAVLLDARAVMAEARRLLRRGGVFALVSGTDKRRRLGLDEAGWRVRERQLAVPGEGGRLTHLLLYSCTATGRAEEAEEEGSGAGGGVAGRTDQTQTDTEEAAAPKSEL